MGRVIHARLDDESDRLLRRLRRSSGQNDSAIVREGLRALDAAGKKSVLSQVTGVGKFSSGIPDLATDKKHMRGFGKS